MESAHAEDYDWDEEAVEWDLDDDERHDAEVENMQEEDVEQLTRPGGHLWRTTTFANFLSGDSV